MITIGIGLYDEITQRQRFHASPGWRNITKLKKKVIERLRDLARDYHAAYGHDILLNLHVKKSETLQEYLTDPRRKKFKEIVNSLSKEERAELLACFWLGRGERATADDWDALMVNARMEDDKGTADYLIAKGPLADYLDRGLKKMKKN